MNVSKVVYLLAFISLLLIGSKTSILLAFVLLAMYTWFSNYRWILFIMLPAIVVLFLPYLFEVSRVLFDVVITRFNNSDSLIDFLGSARIGFVSDAFKIFNAQDVDILRWLIGAGSLISFQLPSSSLVYDTLETDPFDASPKFQFHCNASVDLSLNFTTNPFASGWKFAFRLDSSTRMLVSS